MEALRLIDEFVRTSAEHDVWAVFDWAVARAGDKYQALRRELAQTTAQMIRRLALTSTEIVSLPGTYARAIQRKEFPISCDPVHQNRAFLLADLFDPTGPWVCIRTPDSGLVARIHERDFTARSVFCFVFIRLPGGRALARFGDGIIGCRIVAES